MKYLIILLFPFIAFAGGSHHYDKPTPPPTPVVTPYTPPTATITPPPTPAAIPQPTPIPAPSGGGTQIYCSSPSAPGWNVSLPDGGCSPKTSKNEQVPVKPVQKYVKLNALPPTGETFIDFLLDLFWWL